MAKKVFQNMQKIEVLSEPEKEGCIQIKADAVQAEYLMLHPKEVGYIIIGRMLDLLDTFLENIYLCIGKVLYSSGLFQYKVELINLNS